MFTLVFRISAGSTPVCTTTSVVVSTPEHRLSAVSYTSKHHLFNDGILKDWLEPSEQCGCIRRYGKRFITGDIISFRNMSSANLKESSHGHAGGVRDAAYVAEPCSYVQSGRHVSYGRGEG